MILPSNPITVAGGSVSLPSLGLVQVPIVVDGAGGTIQFAYNESASWTGGSTGTGSLRLTGRIGVDAPLTHDGDLIIDGVRLNVPNTYTGKTVIADNYVIDRGDVFGTATSPIEIDDAAVTVQVLPNGNRGFVVKRGTLNVRTAEPINAGVTLGGVFEASIRGIGTFNGPIDFVTISGGGNAYISGGTFNGPIRGNTTLSLGGNDGVTLNAANDIRGLVHVTSGTVAVNHAQALPLPATLIQGGLVELNTAASGLPMMSRYPYGDRQTGTLRLNVDQHFGGSSYLGEGTLESRADVRFDRLIIRGTEITSAEQGSVTIDHELLVFGSSSVAGGMKGTGTFRMVGTNLNASANLSEFEGDFIVKHGALRFGRAGGFTSPFSINSGSDIHVYPGATVDFGSEEGVIENDIYLHDTNGISPFEGPLTSSGNGGHTLAGRIDVGNVGSTIVESFTITGTFRGRNLAVAAGGLSIKSPQDELAGELRIKNGYVGLVENGRFSGLESIRIENGGVLSINAQSTGPIDRIDDSTAIHLDGGRIELYHHIYLTGSETLGALHLDRGYSEIISRPESPLLVENFERESGSLLRLSLHAGPGGVGFVNAPALNYGMLGAWATTDTGFATLDANNKFATLQPTTANLNTAGPTDHVRATGEQLLTSDRVVASLDNPPTGSCLFARSKRPPTHCQVGRNSFQRQHRQWSAHGRGRPTCRTNSL